MKIKWLGQSCFEIVTENGTRIITDPFAHEDTANFPGLEINYPKPDIEADIVVVSHIGHFDHDAIGIIKGEPIVIDNAGTTIADGIEFKSFGTYHKTADGFSALPFNHVFYWEVDGLSLCHLGDLGYVLKKEQIDEIKEADILFVPVGEGFTMSHADAIENIKLINPCVVIPMHYKTEEVSFLPKTVDDFLGICDMAVTYPENPFSISKDTLPAVTTVCVLKKP